VTNINIDLKKGNDALGIGNDAGALLALAEECGIPIENATINVPASLNGATLVIRAA